MQASKPVVTFLMAVYNCEDFLRESIESMINQTFSDFEIIIINDASNDGSLDILNYFKNIDDRIFVFNNETNLGLTKSLNLGLKLARGKYIARQDADDISYSTRIEKQVSFLESHPEVVLLGAKHVDFDGLSSVVSPYFTSDEIHRNINLFNPISHSSAMFRRDIFLTAGMYDESFITSQDFDAWNRLALHGSVSMLDDILIKRNIHDKSISSTRYFLQVRNTLRIKFLYRRKNLLSTLFTVLGWGVYVLFRNSKRKFCKILKI